MKRRTRWPLRVLEGAGAGILLSPSLLWNELSDTHLDVYHHLLPQTTIIRGIAADLAVLSTVGVLVVLGIEALIRAETAPKGRRPLTPLLWTLWLGFLAGEGVISLTYPDFDTTIAWRQITGERAFLLIAEGLCVLWIFWPRWYTRCVRFLRIGLRLLGVCILWMLPVLLRGGLVHQVRDTVGFRKPVPVNAAQHQRIVWILFDGMSYAQVFPERWPGLQLPTFDRLARTSVTFSDMRPDGSWTDGVIPSLLLGVPIVGHAESTAAGELILKTSPGAPWKRFDETQTVFADARRSGWTTGADGWYNPYCRLLPSQLDSCTMQLLPQSEGFSRDKSTLQNAIAPLLGSGKPTAGPPGQSSSGDLLRNVLWVPPAEALIQDSQINFCFVHLPIPHRPGWYNRKSGELATSGSYLDNLALSDLVLARVLRDIDSTGIADRTTLIVSSDHSWRVWLWQNTDGWTHEDELASRRGRFDDERPMLMVRFPGQTSAANISRPIPLLRMHDLLEGMLAGKVQNQQQLEAWAAQH